jgi:hypothetical protein
MAQRMSRRRFLQGVAAGGAGLLILGNSRSVWSAEANSKLSIAHVGCGGRGQELIDSFSQTSNIVAMCDVNQTKAGIKYRQFPDVPKFEDFRVMLDKMDKQIDAVVIATPDHTHAVASAAAMHHGKHVYSEKPLTRTVHESRVLRELAGKQRVATSMGNQGTGAGPYRRALELIQSGTIGQIREVYIWCEGGSAGHKAAPAEDQKVPPYLNWDLWLGPARMRPFNGRWLGWSAWRDFGTSNLGNWASHSANLAFRALKVDSLWYADAGRRPIIKVQAWPQEINAVGYPRYERVRWDLPARGELPAISFHWVNGYDPAGRGKLEEVMGRPLDWGDNGPKKWTDFAGCVLVGTEGKIYSTGHNATFTFLPAEKFKDIQRDRPEKVEPPAGHEQDFLNAAKGGKPAWANYDYAGPLNEFLQLGNVATQLEGTLEYDPLAGKITNNPEADGLLTSEYRAGWSL